MIAHHVGHSRALDLMPHDQCVIFLLTLIFFLTNPNVTCGSILKLPTLIKEDQMVNNDFGLLLSHNEIWSHIVQYGYLQS